MKYYLVDTHAHLDFNQYDADRDMVIYRAREANVRGIVNIGIDLRTSRKSIELAEAHPNMFAAAGIHPHDVGDATEADIEELFDLLKHPRVVAIGEVGLDFYRNLSPQDLQRKMLRIFLDWSLGKEMPIIIHTRDADEAMLSLLQERCKSGWRGVFHCFSGDEKMSEKVLNLGFHISFTGAITYKNARAVDVLTDVPVEKLLLETDCPFMAPVPHRGKRNEPAYVNLIAQKIAQVKDKSVEEVAQITSHNAERLFGLKWEADEKI